MGQMMPLNLTKEEQEKWEAEEWLESNVLRVARFLPPDRFIFDRWLEHTGNAPMGSMLWNVRVVSSIYDDLMRNKEYYKNVDKETLDYIAKFAIMYCSPRLIIDLTKNLTTDQKRLHILNVAKLQWEGNLLDTEVRGDYTLRDYGEKIIAAIQQQIELIERKIKIYSLSNIELSNPSIQNKDTENSSKPETKSDAESEVIKYSVRGETAEIIINYADKMGIPVNTTNVSVMRAIETADFSEFYDANGAKKARIKYLIYALSKTMGQKWYEQTAKSIGHKKKDCSGANVEDKAEIKRLLLHKTTR